MQEKKLRTFDNPSSFISISKMKKIKIENITLYLI